MKQRLREYIEFINGRFYHIKGNGSFGCPSKTSAGMRWTWDRTEHKLSEDAKKLAIYGTLDEFRTGTPKIKRYKFRKSQERIKNNPRQTIYNSH